MNSQANPFSNNQNVPNDRPESLWAWESEERARNFIESGYSNHRRKVSCANFPATGTGRYSTIVDAVWGHCFDIYEESTHHEFAATQEIHGCFVRPSQALSLPGGGTQSSCRPKLHSSTAKPIMVLPCMNSATGQGISPDATEVWRDDSVARHTL